VRDDGVERDGILFCNCSFNNVLRDDTRRAVLERLQSDGAVFTAVDDLCRIAAGREALLAELAAANRLTVAACHPRAVRSLLAAAGIDLEGGGLHVVDMRSGQPDEAVREIEQFIADGCADSVASDLSPGGDWVPWFPVIDPKRCVNCRQCLSFCLFGVYELSDRGTVTVAKPANCKTNCPACARICPEVAIIFPKYPDGPISGAEIQDEDLERANVKLNVDKMLGGDLRGALARRSRMRRARLRDPDKVRKAFAGAARGDEGVPAAPQDAKGRDREGR